MPHTHDLIIIGYGLAGAALAKHALARGLRIRVFDTPRAGNASLAATGVVNPIVLRHMLPSWRAAQMLEHAEAFYNVKAGSPILPQGLPKGTLRPTAISSFWHSMGLARIFATAQEEQLWGQAGANADAAPFLSRERRSDVDQAPIDRGFGYGIVKRSGWLDVRGWLDEERKRLVEEDMLRDAWIERNMIREFDDHVEVLGDTAPFVVLCDGPFASALPGLSPVRGESLTLRIPGLKLETMVHRGVFVLPLGDDLYRVGSTFAWNDLFVGPTEAGKKSLLDRLKKLTEVPFEVIGHTAGVRPASRDRRPIIGKMKDHQRVAILNGLGARGVLLAPWSAQHLIAHLFDGAVLDQEVDAMRFA